MARKAKPTKLKIATGNPGQRPIHKNEVDPQGKAGEPAEHLSEAAKKEYYRIKGILEPIDLMKDIDQRAIEVYCDVYDRMLTAKQEFIKSGGRLAVKSTKDTIMTNPLLKAWREEEKMFVIVLSKFGMTPSDRVGLQMSHKKNEDENPWLELMEIQKRKLNKK
jgi:P27 family predicted phage terminase small subunit